MRIALIGTRGVPARYGGFETCVEEVGKRLVTQGHEVIVYCRYHAEDGPKLSHYEGMKLVYLPSVKRKSLETLSHSALSILHLIKSPVDVAVVFNSANALLLPLLRLRRIPVAVNVDGLEWRRAKWQGGGRRYYRLAESLAVRWANALIADSAGIAEYYQEEFSAPTEQIAYGAPITEADFPSDGLADLGVQPREFYLVVARFEPENNVDVIVDGYRKSHAIYPLVVVGAAPYADEYVKKVWSLADDRVRFIGAVWDQHLLDQLYVHSRTYLHGHSVGGTNPSLLRAMGAGANTIAYDVRFNHETLQDAGRFFKSAHDVTREIDRSEEEFIDFALIAKAAQRRAESYSWDDVAAKYEALCKRLVNSVGRRSRRDRPSGRRSNIDMDAFLAPRAEPAAPRALFDHS